MGGCARAGAAVAGAEGRVSLLRELAELGMDLARSLRRQVVEAEEAAPAVDAGEAALAFSRLSRAVRLTLALEAKAEAGEDAAGRNAVARPRLDALSLWTPQETLVLDRRALVSQAVDHAIEVEADGDEMMMDRLTAEAEDWLDEEIDEADLLNRPVLELAALICRELDVPFDPSLWIVEEDESPSPPRGGVGVSAQGSPVGDVGLGSSPGAAPAPPPDPLRGPPSPRGGGETELADGVGIGAARAGQSP
ncbi:MAG: hypothetical protein P4L73_01780 [Caulobacteraceae bacterium]|nr:hypothetical protein [Caulobacteraceae bacterium]